MTDNPFQSPKRSGNKSEDEDYADYGDYQIAGKYLICAGEAMLPQYCVISGEESDLEYIEETLVYQSPFNRFLNLAMIPFFFAIPLGWFLLRPVMRPDPRDCCRVSYCLSRRFLVRSRWLIAINVLLVLSAIIWTIVELNLVRRDRLPVLLLSLSPLALAALLTFFIRAWYRPLKLKTLKQGCFWLTGFGAPFVERLKEGHD